MIIQTAFLGDLLLGVPLFKELRNSYPDDKLTVLCRKGLGEFLRLSGLVDEAVEADKASSESWKAAKAELQGRRFDLLLCPHESMRSMLLVLGLRARKKIGYAKSFNFFVFDDRVRRPMELPEALRQLALLQPLDESWQGRLDEFAKRQAAPGGQGSSNGQALVEVPSWADMKIPRLTLLREAFFETGRLDRLSSERVKLTAERIRAGKKPLAFLAPGSVWATKMWTADGYVASANALQERGFQVVVMGAPDEKRICNEVVARSPGAISIAGETSLFESAELLALADVLICNDSGAMHLAATSGVPTVTIFGPTVLDLGYRPWQNRARVVQVPRSEMPCRPCGKHGARACPLGHHQCMKRVSADSVLASVEELKTT